MGPDKHTICGVILGVAMYGITKDAGTAITTCASATLVDLDHFLEYGMYCKKYKKKPTVKQFFTGDYFPAKGTIYVIFHGYEYLALFAVLTIIAIVFDWRYRLVMCGFTLGYLSHMILDAIGNDCIFRGYFILYRIKEAFNEKKLCKKN